MKRLLYFTLILFFFFQALHINAQQNIYHRDNCGTGNWWDSNLPWYYATWNNNQNKPDNDGRGNVFIGHNNYTSMTVNGAFFQLRTLTFEIGASTGRSLTSAESGGISLSVGLYNNSPGSHTFNVPIGVDATSVDFAANSGALSFTTTFFINANTAIFSGSSNIEVSGTMEGTGGKVTKSGDGTLTLSGGNTYTGLTTVSGGTLVLNKTGGNTIPSTNSITVNGGTLKISTNQTLNDVTLSSGSIVVNADATLTIDGTMTISGGTITGSGTIVYGANGSLVYSSSENSLDYTPGKEWPSSGGPKNLTLNLSGNGEPKITLPGTRVLSGNLTLTDGTFVIPSSFSLTVSGTLTNNAGNSGLIIKSDATGNGSLITSSGVGATVERYTINADWSVVKDGWHFISAPVSGQAIDPAFTTSPASGYDFYCWYEPSNLWVNYKNTTTAPTWNDANGSTNFTVGKGYMAAYDNGGTKQFTGNLNVSDVAVSGLTRTSGNNKGYHLLGNPFPCGLTWDATPAWTLSNIGGVAKYWNEGSQSYSDLTSSPSSVIPSGSGFMVSVSSAPGSLTIPASKKTASVAPGYKTTIPGIKFTAYSIQENNAQECSVYFNPEATDGFDNMFDSEFLAGYGPEFYSVSNNLHLSTNSLPGIPFGMAIPFGFKPNSGTDYTLQVTGLETLDPSAIVYLVDKKTGTEQNLLQNSVYQFTASAGDNPDRFELKFGAVGINDPATSNSLDAWYYNNQLYISKINEKAVVTLRNLQGQALSEFMVTEAGPLNVSSALPSGIYIAQITSSGITRSVKIFVE